MKLCSWTTSSKRPHLEREIIHYLDGVRTVFDGGAGTGRFSIFLAQLGVRVTHFDISHAMLAFARQKDLAAGVQDHIEFVQGRLTELDAYRDGQFDMVISFDAPVSYIYLSTALRGSPRTCAHSRAQSLSRSPVGWGGCRICLIPAKSNSTLSRTT